MLTVTATFNIIEVWTDMSTIQKKGGLKFDRYISSQRKNIRKRNENHLHSIVRWNFKTAFMAENQQQGAVQSI